MVSIPPTSVHLVVHPDSEPPEALWERLCIAGRRNNESILNQLASETAKASASEPPSYALPPELDGIHAIHVVASGSFLAILTADGRIARVAFDVDSAQVERQTAHIPRRISRKPKPMATDAGRLEMAFGGESPSRSAEVRAALDSRSRHLHMYGSGRDHASQLAARRAEMEAFARREQARMAASRSRAQARQSSGGEDVPAALIDRVLEVLPDKSRDAVARALRRTRFDAEAAINILVQDDEEGDSEHGHDDMDDESPPGARSGVPFHEMELPMPSYEPTDMAFGVAQPARGGALVGLMRRDLAQQDWPGHRGDLDPFTVSASDVASSLGSSRSASDATTKQDAAPKPAEDTADEQTKPNTQGEYSFGKIVTWWSHKDPNMSFVSIAAMHSELLAVDSDGNLCRWRWKDPISEAGPHPRLQALGLHSEQVASMSACELRASFITRSGKVASMQDEVCLEGSRTSPSSLHFLEHQARVFDQFQHDAISSIKVSSATTMAITSSGQLYSWGLRTLAGRERLVQKHKEARKSLDQDFIKPGDQVVLRDNPLYLPGAIAVTTTEGEVTKLKLLDTVFSLRSSYRFQVLGEDRILDLALSQVLVVDVGPARKPGRVVHVDGTLAAVVFPDDDSAQGEESDSPQASSSQSNAQFADASWKRARLYQITDLLAVDESGCALFKSASDSGKAAMISKHALANPVRTEPKQVVLLSLTVPNAPNRQQRQEYMSFDEERIIRQSQRIGRQATKPTIKRDRLKAVACAVVDNVVHILAKDPIRNSLKILGMDLDKKGSSWSWPVALNPEMFAPQASMLATTSSVALIRDAFHSLVSGIASSEGLFEKTKPIDLPPVHSASASILRLSVGGKMQRATVLCLTLSNQPVLAAAMSLNVALLERSLSLTDAGTKDASKPASAMPEAAKPLSTVADLIKQVFDCSSDDSDSDADDDDGTATTTENGAKTKARKRTKQSTGGTNRTKRARKEQQSATNASEPGSEAEPASGRRKKMPDVEMTVSEAVLEPLCTTTFDGGRNILHVMLTSTPMNMASKSEGTSQDQLPPSLSHVDQLHMLARMGFEHAAALLRESDFPTDDGSTTNQNVTSRKEIIRWFMRLPPVQSFLPRLMKHRDDRGNTPLTLALEARHYDIFVDMLQACLGIASTTGVPLESLMLPHAITGLPPSHLLPQLVPACTLEFTSQNMVSQPIFGCADCKIHSSLCICVNCARTCHAGHKLVYKGVSSQAFCDCREQECCTLFKLRTKSPESGHFHDPSRSTSLVFQELIKTSAFSQLNARGESLVFTIIDNLARESQFYGREMRSNPMNEIATTKSRLSQLLSCWPALKATFLMDDMPGQQGKTERLDRVVSVLLTETDLPYDRYLGPVLRTVSDKLRTLSSDDEASSQDLHAIVRFVRSVVRVFMNDFCDGAPESPTDKATSNSRPPRPARAWGIGMTEPSPSSSMPVSSSQFQRDHMSGSMAMGEVRECVRLKHLAKSIVATNCQRVFFALRGLAVHELANAIEGVIAPVRLGVARPLTSYDVGFPADQRGYGGFGGRDESEADMSNQPSLLRAFDIDLTWLATPPTVNRLSSNADQDTSAEPMEDDAEGSLSDAGSTAADDMEGISRADVDAGQTRGSSEEDEEDHIIEDEDDEDMDDIHIGDEDRSDVLPSSRTRRHGGLPDMEDLSWAVASSQQSPEAVIRLMSHRRPERIQTAQPATIDSTTLALARLFSRATKTLVDVAFGPRPTDLSLPNGSGDTAFETEILCEARINANIALERTWQWLSSVLDSLEAQLQLGRDLHAQHKTHSNLVPSQEEKRARRASPGATREHLYEAQETFRGYVSSLLRGRSTEHGGSLPSVDLKSYGHLAHCLDGLMYYFTHRTTVLSSGTAPGDRRSFFTRSDSISTGPADNEPFFHLPLHQNLPLAERPDKLRADASRRSLFGSSGQTVEAAVPTCLMVTPRLSLDMDTASDEPSMNTSTSVENANVEYVSARWVTVSRAFSKLFVKTVGRERSSFLNLLAGFKAKEASFRSEMARLAGSVTSDLSFSVSRERDSLLQTTYRVMFEHGIGRASASAKPFCVRQVKVHFKDEIATGSGVTRAFYATLCDELVKNEDLPMPPPSGNSRELRSRRRGPEKRLERRLREHIHRVVRHELSESAGKRLEQAIIDSIQTPSQFATYLEQRSLSDLVALARAYHVTLPSLDPEPSPLSAGYARSPAAPSGRKPDVTFDLSSLLYSPGKPGFYSPRPAKPSTDQTVRLAWFRNIGRFMGMCLLHGDLFLLRFNRHVYKYMLGREISWHDLAFFDPDLFESLRKILFAAEQDPASVAQLGITFQISVDSSVHHVQHIDLKPNGEHIDVTASNVHEYAELYAKHLMIKAAEPALQSIKSGMEEALPLHALDGLSAEDLQLLLNGPSVCDMKMLRKVVTVIDESNEPQKLATAVKWFWQVVESMTPAQQHDLIYFWTSLPGLPATSDALSSRPALVFKSSSSQNLLPTANTCVSRLTLPLYPTKKMMRDKLLQAAQVKGFGFV